MRKRSFFARPSAALAAALMMPVGGCALFYGYSGYHGDTGAGGSAGAGPTAGGGGASSSNTNSGGGGLGGGGGAGGGCPTAPDPYSLGWLKIYGNASPSSVVGVHLGSNGPVTLLANVRGTLKVGTKTVTTGSKQGMLVAELGKQGDTSFAEAFSDPSHAGDVTATALSVDSSGDVHAAGSFGTSIAVGMNTWAVGQVGAVNSAVVGLTTQTGVLTADTHQIRCDPGGAPSCSVTVASVAKFGGGLYLGGTFKGLAHFDGASTIKLSGVDADGYAAIYGVTAYGLQGSDIQAITGFVETDDGNMVAVGNVTTSAKFFKYDNVAMNLPCGSEAAADPDVFLLKYQGTSNLWMCADDVQDAMGEQSLDAVLPVAGGGVVVAGRTTGDVKLGGHTSPNPNPGSPVPAIFVGRLGSGNDWQWTTVVPLKTTTPVHLDATSDGNSVIVSGAFSGALVDEHQNSIMSRGSGDNGFAILFDGTQSGQQGWTRALVPCADSGGPTSLVAALNATGSIAIAGTVDGPATFAGQLIDAGDKPSLFVARLNP